MKSLPVAIQVYSVRDDAAKDYFGTLKKLKAMGYDGVELAGTLDFTPEQMKGMLAEAGLIAVSAHVPLGEFDVSVEGTVKKYKAIGCEYIALPFLPDNMRPHACDFDTTVARIREIGEACKAHGVVFAYHNHDFEFVNMADGTYCLDYIYKHVPPELLQVQPDVCWIHVSGEDPAAYIRKYPGRCPMVHLKDYLGEKSEGMYKLMDEADDAAKDGGGFRFRHVGAGRVNIPEVLAASLEAGAKWVIVEQDMSITAPMIEEVKSSRDYLKSLGW